MAEDKFTKLQKLLIILGFENGTSMPRRRIVEIATTVGLNEIKKWNVSDILGKSKGFAVLGKAGWELTTKGQKFVSQYLQFREESAPISVLRESLKNISDNETKEFIQEAIRCFEAKCFRAAIVMSWVGAVYVLQKHVHASKLKDFNAEAFRRDAKWKNAKTTDDMSRMKESDFLDVLDAMSILGKNVKKELKNGLDLRNGCGHPNSLVVNEHKVAAHIECLIDNVFSKFC